MMKKIVAVGLSLLLFLAVGCDKPDNKKEDSDPVFDIPSEEEYTEPVTYTNPLTGIGGYTEDISAKRPIAVMINNISVAQPVQTGINKADIVYETEVEGGITRLMAVFQDFESVDQLGTIRSARYPYVDLALGHDALYLHCGSDPTYCAPHLKDIDDCDLNHKDYGKRISNGLSKEHTLYLLGKDVWQNLSKDGERLTSKSTQSWQEFASEDQPVTLAGGVCTSVAVPFSQSYKTSFTYDASTGLYTRLSNDAVRKDYRTGESTDVKNVFVLMTAISDYSDNYHRRVALDGGDGFYITNGTFAPIKWTKGNSKNAFNFTNADGSALTVNAGHSWVCIADSGKSQPVIQ